MFTLAAFTGYLVSTLFFHGYFKSLITIIFFSSYLFYHEIYQLKSLKKNLFGFLFAGLLAGFSYSFFIHSVFEDIAKQDYPEIIQARIFTTTSTYYFLEFKNKNDKKVRFKLKKSALLNMSQKEYFLFDSLTLNCHILKSQATDSTTVNLDNLRRVTNTCIEAKIINSKSANDKLNYFRKIIKDYIVNKLSGLKHGSYAAGFLLSESSSVSPAELKIFRNMGVAHLFSPSGLHMGLLFGTFVFLFRILKLPSTGNILGIVICMVYIIILDFRISILRAFSFLIIYSLLKIFNRKTESRHVLYFSAILLEIIFPLSCFSVSFILSFTITLVIMLLYPRHKKVIIFGKDFWKQHLSLTLSASAASAFLSLGFFGYFHPLSILYNLLMVPLAGIYLSSVFLYIFIPVFKYLIYTGDFIYQKFTLFHFYVVEKTLPGLDVYFVIFWLGLFFCLLAYFVFFSDNKKYWYLRKYYFKIYFLLCIFFAGNYFNIRYPDKAIFAFPYGVIYYENRNIYFEGKPADFYKKQFHYVMSQTDFPFKKVYSGSKISESVQSQFLPRGYEINLLGKQPLFNTIILDGNCFLFISKKESADKYFINKRFNNKKYKSCKTIYLIHAKNNSPDISYYRKVISDINPDVQIYQSGFMKWYFTYDDKKKFFQ
jgi:ComEC/Rec2-related protein